MNQASFVVSSRSRRSWCSVTAIARLSLLFVLIAVRPVSAQPMHHVSLGVDDQGRWVERYASPGDGEYPQQAVENYDNYRQPGGGGNTVFFDDLRVGDHEIGDDVVLGEYSGGILDSLGLSRVNLSSDGTWDDFHMALRFYRRQSLELLSSIEGNVDAIPLDPGGRVLMRFDEGALQRYNLQIDEDIYVTVQFSDIQGIDAADAGQVVGGPINTGSSTRFVRDFTSGQFIDLGDARQANLGLFVKSVVVPAPGLLVGLVVMACTGGARGLRRREDSARSHHQGSGEVLLNRAGAGGAVARGPG